MENNKVELKTKTNYHRKSGPSCSP